MTVCLKRGSGAHDLSRKFCWSNCVSTPIVFALTDSRFTVSRCYLSFALAGARYS